MDKPKVGRVVLFYTTDVSKRFNGQENGPYPAIVTQSFDGPYVNLKVFPPFGAPYDEGSVSEKSDTNTSRYWEWAPH